MAGASQSTMRTNRIEPKSVFAPALTTTHRCHREFDALCRWLRSHGVVSKKPLHTLRKEFGSQIHARALRAARRE